MKKRNLILSLWARLFAIIAPAVICLGAGVAKIDAQDTNSTSAGWAKYSGNPVLGGDYGTCFDISVLNEGDTYRMWFSWRPKASIALVESKDGFHWSTPVIVFRPDKTNGWENDVNRPVVIKQGGVYRMWYTGQTHDHSAIGYATSSDGIVWKRMSNKPVLSPAQPWEKVALMCPDVIWDNKAKLYKMWYSGGDQYEPDAVGYAGNSFAISSSHLARALPEYSLLPASITRLNNSMDRLMEMRLYFSPSHSTSSPFSNPKPMSGFSSTVLQKQTSIRRNGFSSRTLLYFKDGLEQASIHL